MERIQRATTQLFLALALAASPGALLAQATATEPESTEAKETGNTGGTASAPAERDDSPFDYQPSEEISEDLPVSFPVDI